MWIYAFYMGRRYEKNFCNAIRTTNVERKSRYLLAAKLASKSAAETAQAVASAFRRIPARLRRTLTRDNGKEFARFRDIEKHSGFRIYFADPYSAWQRGTNENTNGLLRRYFPKGMDFGAVTEKTLAEAVKKLKSSSPQMPRLSDSSRGLHGSLPLRLQCEFAVYGLFGQKQPGQTGHGHSPVKLAGAAISWLAPRGG